MNALQKYRKLRKLSQSQLAERAGTSQPQIKRLENGERKLTVEWAERLAPHLDVDAEKLLFPDSQIGAELASAPVLGTIQAGVWVEAVAMPEPRRMPVVETGGYDIEHLYVLQVKGDSMDLFVKDGGYVVCVKMHESRRPLRPGMIVHVERRRDGGQLVETTLKQIKANGAKFVLAPQSSNPDHHTIELNGAEGDEIEVRGLVLGRYDPAPVR